jgi:hypothetical protein
MRHLRTTFAAAALAAAALLIAACVPPPTGGGGTTTTHAPTTTSTTTTTVVAPTPPPYEPLPNPPAVGTLKFFNAAGQQVTSGNINDAPFATYIQSSAPGRTEDIKATLYGYLPKSGVPYDAWTGQQLTASPNYPNASAPGALGTSTLPLVTVTAGDYTLSQLAASFPNTATDAYQGLYQLRVKTSGPGVGIDVVYSRADIKITGTTWTLVYPVVPTTTTTTAAPTTTTAAPTTTTAAPTTTTAAPTTTTAAPTTPTTTVPSGNDLVTLTLRGALNYSNSGTGSGGVDVQQDRWGVLAAVGTLDLPSTVSGTAVVTFDIHRAWILPLWFGHVDVSDPAAGINVKTPVLGAVSPGLTTDSAAATSHWVVQGKWPNLFRPYVLRWSVLDAG